jgi:uncharacterized protein YprB with RNaseH-like and TPR domain
VFDLETTALEGDRGIVLCASYESSDYKGVHTLRADDLNHGWNKGRRGDDSGVVAGIATVLKAHDVVVAHNGSRFDIPFLRTRMLKWRMPRLPDLKLVDPCSVLFRKFRMRSNSLNALLDFLELKDRKTPLDMAVWAEAMNNGTRSAMDKIVKHCVKDVRALSAAFDIVKPYVKLIDDRGSSL